MKRQKIDNAYIREVIQCLMRGIIIFLLSMGIIVSGDREGLLSLLITNQLPFSEIFAMFTFLFSVCVLSALTGHVAFIDVFKPCLDADLPCPSQG